MIDWETIAVFMLVDSVVHVVIGLLFLPIGGKFMLWFAKRTFMLPTFLLPKAKTKKVKTRKVAKTVEELFT